MDKNKTKFTQWVQLAECKTLKPNQRIILISILNLHNIEGWDFTPLSVLNEKNGISVSTIQRSIKGLVKMGLIEKVSNRNRKKCGKDPNDYIPNYTNILNLLNSQIGQIDHNKNNSYGQNDHNSYSQNDHNDMVKMTNKNNRKKEKEKNKASIYSTYNDSTRRYMVYPDNENNNNQMKDNITNNPENGQPINDLQVFDFSDRGWDNPKDEETTCEYATTRIVKTNPKTAAGNDNTKTTDTNTANPNSEVLGFNEAVLGFCDSPTATEETAAESDKSKDTETTPTATNIQEAQINGRGEVLASNVDSYSTETEKTAQGRNKEGNLEMDTVAEDTQIPNNGENTAPTTNTLSMEDTKRIMSQAAQTIMKNRKHAAADTQNAPKNDRGEEITPQADNYTTEAEKTPQGAKNSGMAADTADTRPIFNTIRTAAEWKVRHDNDSCWEETFEHAAEGLETPLEAEIRTLLNQVYKDWQNHTPSINTKMINDMKVYAERHYGIILTSKEKKEKKGTVNYYIPRHDAVPTTDEIEKISVCHISKNKDILNRLSAGCKQVNTVILALNKAIEFTQIYRIATPQQYDCITNAMSILDKCPTVSDKKAKYITDLATHLCDMLEKVCHS